MPVPVVTVPPGLVPVVLPGAFVPGGGGIIPGGGGMGGMPKEGRSDEKEGRDRAPEKLPMLCRPLIP